MKVTKRVLAMVIAAMMVLTMMPAVVLAALPATGGKFDSTSENFPWNGQDVGQTVVLHYSYTAKNANDTGSIPSGAVFVTAATSGTQYKGIINSTSTEHLIAGSGFTAGGCAKKFAAIEGEKVYATVLITRYQNTSEGVVTEEGSNIVYLMNGVEVYSETVKNAWIRNQSSTDSWKAFGLLGNKNTFALCPGTAPNEDKFKYSWFYGVDGVLDEAGIAELKASYNASVNVTEGCTDIKITGNGVDGKIITNLGIDMYGEMTVAELKANLTGAEAKVYATADAVEELGENEIVPDGAVLKTASSNGFTKLTYTVARKADPINMTWSVSGTGAAGNKAFARDQKDGETIVVRYKYRAYNGNETGSMLSGIMLDSNDTWDGNTGLVNSNATNHYVRPTDGFNANAIYSFPAVEGEEMQIAAFITRNGEGSKVIYYINGERGDLDSVSYNDRYIGANSWKQLSSWGRVNENAYFDAEVITLGNVEGDDFVAEQSKYDANLQVKSGVSAIGIGGRGAGGRILAGFKINYKRDGLTVGEIKEMLSVRDGVKLDFYEDIDSATPLEDDAVITEDTVIRTESANGFTKNVYTFEKYANENIVFSTNDDGSVTATVSNRFALEGKIFLAAFAEINGSLKLETVKISAPASSEITASLTKDEAEGKVVKAFYLSPNLSPIAMLTK